MKNLKTHTTNNTNLMIDTLNLFCQNGIQSRDDIIKILCWKIGGRQIDDYSVKNRNYTITINDQFVEFVINSSVATDDDAVEALKTIMEVPNIVLLMP